MPVLCGVAKTEKSSLFFSRCLYLTDPWPIFAKNGTAMLVIEEQLDQIAHCPMCGKVVSYGRVDRRFCRKKKKNRYHNRLRYIEKEKQKEVRHVMRVLHENREVLEKLIKLGMTSIDRLTLLHLGFNMCYFTSLQKIRNRWVYSCLDIQYELTPTRIKNLRYLWEGVGEETAAGELPTG